MRNNLELMMIEAAKLSKHDIIVIIGNQPKIFPNTKNPFLRKFAKLIQLIIGHIDLGRQINAAKDKDAVIVYAFSTEFLFFTFLFSFWTKNVYLVNNHNVQQAHESKLMNFIFKIYHHLKYKFIILEDDSVLMDLGYTKQDLEQHLSLPHTVVKNIRNPDTANLLKLADHELQKKKVGIIGQSRQGKKFSDTLDLMLRIAKKLDILLIIGTDDFSCFDGMDLQGVKLIDTSTNDAYLAALSACDVVVLNYEKSAYFYRCSGVAADAIGVQVYVVCPDFPFMSKQVNWPTTVGVVYKDETELETSLQKALELSSKPDAFAFESHYKERSILETMLIFDKAIQANSEV